MTATSRTAEAEVHRVRHSGILNRNFRVLENYIKSFKLDDSVSEHVLGGLPEDFIDYIVSYLQRQEESESELVVETERLVGVKQKLQERNDALVEAIRKTQADRDFKIQQYDALYDKTRHEIMQEGAEVREKTTRLLDEQRMTGKAQHQLKILSLELERLKRLR